MTILKDTLTGTMTTQPEQPAIPKGLAVPDTTGDAGRDIANLKGAQKKPSLLMDFQKAMQLSSRQAYNDRQTAEMGITGEQFDPTKVSGNTFAGIIGNLEKRRGADISKVHQSTMEAYQNVQNMVTQRLQFLQQQEQERKEFEANMEFREKELDRLKENDDKAYAMEQAKFDFEKEKYAYGKSKGGGSSDEYTDKVLGDFSEIKRGEDGYVDTREAINLINEAGTEAETIDEIYQYNKIRDHIISQMNPADAEGAGLIEYEW